MQLLIINSFNSELRGFEFVKTLVFMFEKIESEDKTKNETFYSNSKAEIIINESDIDLFQSIYATVISNIQKFLGKVQAYYWFSHEHNISISKYSLLAESSYFKLPKELDHPRKGWINIQNIKDNECFKIKLNFKDIKYPVKVRKYFRAKR